MNETRCVDAGQLTRMLEGRLEADEGEAVEAHVQSCSSCQGKLDQLTESPNSAIEPTPCTETVNFLDRLKLQPWQPTDIVRTTEGGPDTAPRNFMRRC